MVSNHEEEETKPFGEVEEFDDDLLISQDDMDFSSETEEEEANWMHILREELEDVSANPLVQWMTTLILCKRLLEIRDEIDEELIYHCIAQYLELAEKASILMTEQFCQKAAKQIQEYVAEREREDEEEVEDNGEILMEDNFTNH